MHTLKNLHPPPDGFFCARWKRQKQVEANEWTVGNDSGELAEEILGIWVVLGIIFGGSSQLGKCMVS